MDKMLSARVDEAVIRQIGSLADELGTTKKAVIEEAVRLYGEKVRSGEADVFERTLGAWSRKEPPSGRWPRPVRPFANPWGERARLYLGRHDHL